MSEHIAFDTERARGIAQEVVDIVKEHAALAERTSNPMFLDLIALSRQWWLRWRAIGLCEVAGVPDSGDLADGLSAAIGDVEREIIERAGRPGYDTFTKWADEQDVGFEAPIYVRDNARWSGPPTLRLVAPR